LEKCTPKIKLTTRKGEKMDGELVYIKEAIKELNQKKVKNMGGEVVVGCGIWEYNLELVADKE